MDRVRVPKKKKIERQSKDYIVLKKRDKFGGKKLVILFGFGNAVWVCIILFWICFEGMIYKKEKWIGKNLF